LSAGNPTLFRERYLLEPYKYFETFQMFEREREKKREREGDKERGIAMKKIILNLSIF
jgi:hypothetical protein